MGWEGMPQPEIVAVQGELFGKKEKTNSVNRGLCRIVIVNAAMLALVAAMSLFYVINTNEITADYYRIQLLNENLSALNGITADLTMKQNSFDRYARVLEFARSRNMVEAKNAANIFENREVAVQR